MRIQNYINGKLIEPNSGAYLDNIDPQRQKYMQEILDSDASDIQEAVIASKKAFFEWSMTSRKERSDLMMKVADLIDVIMIS